MLNFTVEGPFEVPFYQGKAAKAISAQEGREFWDGDAELTARRGCYVFAIRAGGGITPLYVGKATTSFRKEVFTNDKLAKYQRGLADYMKGTPVLFLVMAPQTKGAPNKAVITELEDFLIQTAVSVNPDLLNIRGKKSAEFGITGVFRSGVGMPSKAARAFKNCMSLE